MPPVSVNEPMEMPNVFAGGDGWDDLETDEKADDGSESNKLADEMAAVEEEVNAEKDEPEKEGEEAAEKEEPAKEAAGKDQKQEVRIPKQRFDAVNERMKRAEAALAEAEAAKKAAAEATTGQFDFDGKETEYMDAVLDGDHSKAKAIRAEIRSAEQAQFEQLAAKTTTKSTEQAKAQIEFDNAVSELESAYAPFNPNSDDFDEPLVAEVLDVYEGLVARGYAQSDALRRAARYVVPDAFAEKPVVVEEKPAEKPAPPARKTNVKKNAEAAAKQPPSTDKVGEGTTAAGASAINPADLTEEEFDSLPESKKAQLRGDFV